MAGVGKLLKQAQKMQRQIEVLQTQLEAKEIDVTSGGGAVKIKVNGAGKFTAPEAVAVDGFGRVYVSDFFGIQVFDPDGAYLRTFSTPDKRVAFGMTFDDQNNLYAVTNSPSAYKFQIQKP